MVAGKSRGDRLTRALGEDINQSGEARADRVALHNRNLQTIYITHGHFAYFYGLGVLPDRFPGARAIATPKTVEAMQSL